MALEQESSLGAQLAFDFIPGLSVLQLLLYMFVFMSFS